MRNTMKSIATSALWVGLAATATGGNASAVPINVVSLRGLEASSLTDQISCRRYYRGRYYRRGYTPGAAAPDRAAAAIAYSNPYYGYPPYADYPAYAYPYDYAW
jgi:hypothetical protein